MIRSNFDKKRQADSPLLVVDGLRIEGESSGEWREIVRGVSFTLNRGEVIGLIGESGAGKSTIGLAALGYARPGCRFSGGRVLYDGQDLLTMRSGPLRALRGLKISYVAQSAAAFFNPAHRLIDQFAEVFTCHGSLNREAARRKAEQLYELLGMPDPKSFGNRYPHQVSGGQLQRAMIAMAMAGDPDLVVFDEPTTALDVTTQVGVLLAIRNAVRALGTAALYITHDLPVVAQIADRIIVLRHGGMVEEGDTKDMISGAKEDYTRRLLAADPEQRPEREEKPPILTVNSVSAFYGRKQILHDVSISVPLGRTTAIVGESGSGKSTLARVITGLLKSMNGEVVFEGALLPKRLDMRKLDTLRRIQLIYQSPDTALNPRHTVTEIIGRPLQLYHNLKGPEIGARVGDLLEQVELARDLADRFPSELSGGQKQRVCIARALAAEPDLVICDEITSGLDPLVAKGVLNLLARLQERSGTSYIFITHDLKIVAAMADQIVVMKNGRIVEAGRRSEIMSPPYADYTETLLSAVPQLDVTWLDGVVARQRLDRTANVQSNTADECLSARRLQLTG